jgi:hypothetical protein
MIDRFFDMKRDDLPRQAQDKRNKNKLLEIKK